MLSKHLAIRIRTFYLWCKETLSKSKYLQAKTDKNCEIKYYLYYKLLSFTGGRSAVPVKVVNCLTTSFGVGPVNKNKSKSAASTMK